MVTLVQLREYMKKQAEADRSKKSVQVTGSSIEEALGQASIELGLPVKQIEYEVLEKGSRGAFGAGKKDFILIAYPLVEEEDISSFEESLGFVRVLGTERFQRSVGLDPDHVGVLIAAIKVHASAAILELEEPLIVNCFAVEKTLAGSRN